MLAVSGLYSFESGTNCKQFGRKWSWLKKYCLGIWLKGLSKTRTNLSQDSKCHGRRSNRKPPEYKFRPSSLHQIPRNVIRNYFFHTVDYKKFPSEERAF